MNWFLSQGGHLHCTQPGTTEESPNASETEHVRSHFFASGFLHSRVKLLNQLHWTRPLVFLFFLNKQVVDWTTEKTSSYSEDVNHEGQHNQHLCYGKLAFFFLSVKVFVTLCYFSHFFIGLSGFPALLLSDHLPISQSVWWKHPNKGALHALLKWVVYKYQVCLLLYFSYPCCTLRYACFS